MTAIIFHIKYITEIPGQIKNAFNKLFMLGRSGLAFSGKKLHSGKLEVLLGFIVST